MNALDNPGAAVAVIRLRMHNPEYLVLKRAVNPFDPWSGHFALPGGRRDPSDADLFATCLRETREECGIHLAREHLVRELPWCRAGREGAKGTLVAPYLFELPGRPVLEIAAAEIAEYHWVPLSHLLDLRNHGEHFPHSPSVSAGFPGIRLGRGYVWGFTYKVITALLEDYPSEKGTDPGAGPDGAVSPSAPGEELLF